MYGQKSLVSITHWNRGRKKKGACGIKYATAPHTTDVLIVTCPWCMDKSNFQERLSYAQLKAQCKGAMHAYHYGATRPFDYANFQNIPKGDDMIHYRANAQEKHTFCGKEVWRVKSTTQQVSKVTCSRCASAIQRRRQDAQRQSVRKVKQPHLLPDIKTKLARPDPNCQQISKMPLRVRGVSSNIQGLEFEATGQFRPPEHGEYFFEQETQRVLRCILQPDNCYVIMKTIKTKEPLTEKHLMDWLMGHRMEPLVIECHSCGCDGWIGPVHVRAAPHSFEHIGFYHGDKTNDALAILEKGTIAFMEDVKGKVFLAPKEDYGDYTYVDYD
jgi:hypothetical protein